MCQDEFGNPKIPSADDSSNSKPLFTGSFIFNLQLDQKLNHQFQHAAKHPEVAPAKDRRRQKPAAARGGRERSLASASVNLSSIFPRNSIERMEIGGGITSSFNPAAAGTTGLFLQGSFFGTAGIALLTNAHVIGAKPASDEVWKALLKIWGDDFKQGKNPVEKRKTLYERLGAMIPDFQNGRLDDNPTRGTLFKDASNKGNSIFTGTNSHLKLRDLFCSISVEGSGVASADAIYQPMTGSDFAVALLRTGTLYDQPRPPRSIGYR